MNKENELEEQLNVFEKEKREIEKKIRNTKILLRHLKTRKNFKEIVIKTKRKGKLFRW
jgi:hypothetical protein